MTYTPHTMECLKRKCLSLLITVISVLTAVGGCCILLLCFYDPALRFHSKLRVFKLENKQEEDSQIFYFGVFCIISGTGFLGYYRQSQRFYSHAVEVLENEINTLKAEISVLKSQVGKPDEQAVTCRCILVPVAMPRPVPDRPKRHRR